MLGRGGCRERAVIVSLSVSAGMGEVCYPVSGRLEVERGLAVQHERDKEVLSSSAMYNRRDMSLCVSKLTEDVIEILRENSPSANGKLLCDQVVCSLGGRGLQLVSSVSGLRMDSSTLVVNRTEVPEVPETCETPATFSPEDRAVLSEVTISSDIADHSLANRDISSIQLECHSCKLRIPSSPMISCSQKGCFWSYHQSCTKNLRGCSWRKNGNLVCPQHICHACGGSRAGRLWKCERCPIASHELCSPWPRDITFSKDSPGWAICWRHNFEERLPLKLSTTAVSYLHKQRTSDTKEVFNRLPILDVVEDFTISLEFVQKVMENEKEPPPYTHIRRNVFLIKRKRDDSDDGVRCLCGNEGSDCGENCDCRVQSMSCSKDCVCKKVCTNKPYRKEKRLKVVKTEFCGWGAKAAEVIRKGEFIIEYIGEVIDDAMCEKRLWAMKGRGINNFYMCEIMKDFIIDATFKGNPSRYLNHSCQPNCKLEKWRVDGATRAGVFALKDISVGEPLTYNYKYVEFGPDVKCCCGAPNCRGAIGERLQKTMMEEILKWGKQGRRSRNRSSKRPKQTFENPSWRVRRTSSF